MVRNECAPYIAGRALRNDGVILDEPAEGLGVGGGPTGVDRWGDEERVGVNHNKLAKKMAQPACVGPFYCIQKIQKLSFLTTAFYLVNFLTTRGASVWMTLILSN